MTSTFDKPKIGLLVTAMMEDEWNKTAYLRPAAAEATAKLARILEGIGTVVCPGLVETEEQAAAADLAFKQAGVEAVVLAELAYTQSLIPMRALANTQVPVVVWNTQDSRNWPQDADLDFVWLNSGLAGIPETTHALVRSGRPFSMVTGHSTDARSLAKLRRHCLAAAICQRLRWLQLGLVGHPYQSMSDLMVDTYSLRDRIGPTVVHVETEDVAATTAAVSTEDARALMAETSARWRTDELDGDVFERSARCALGLERVVRAHGLGALAHFEQGMLADPRCGVAQSWGTSRLMALGIPTACEGDMPTTVGMWILQALAGEATFVEDYGFDFDQGAAYVAHDSMGNPNLAASEPQVALRHSIYYRGLHGMGAALEFAYKPGPVTFLALVQLGRGEWKMVVGEGESLPLKPRPTVAPQMLFRPAGSALEDFFDKWCLAGAGHHSAVAYGHLSQDLTVLAGMLGIDAAVVR